MRLIDKEEDLRHQQNVRKEGHLMTFPREVEDSRRRVNQRDRPEGFMTFPRAVETTLGRVDEGFDPKKKAKYQENPSRRRVLNKQELFENESRTERRPDLRPPKTESAERIRGFMNSPSGDPFGESGERFSDFLSKMTKNNRPVEDTFFGGRISPRPFGDANHVKADRRIDKVDFGKILDGHYGQNDPDPEEKKTFEENETSMRPITPGVEPVQPVVQPQAEKLAKPNEDIFESNKAFVKNFKLMPNSFKKLKKPKKKVVRLKKPKPIRNRQTKPSTTITTTTTTPLPRTSIAAWIQDHRAKLTRNKSPISEPRIDTIRDDTERLISTGYQEFKLGKVKNYTRNEFRKPIKKVVKYDDEKRNFYESSGNPASFEFPWSFPTYQADQRYITTTPSPRRLSSLKPVQVRPEDFFRQDLDENGEPTPGPFYYKPHENPKTTTIAPMIDQFQAPKSDSVRQFFHDHRLQDRISRRKDGGGLNVHPIKKMIGRVRVALGKHDRLTQTAAILLPYSLLFYL